MSSSSRKKRVCLTGGWFSSLNIGDHAMLCGVMDFLGQSGDVEFSVITAGPDRVRKLYSIPAFAPKKTPLALLLNLFRSDILAFTGGTPFYEKPVHMTYYWALAKFARLTGAKIIVLGVSLRSLKSRYCKFLLRGILGSCDFIGAREETTFRAFKDSVKDTAVADKLHLVPDMACAMKPIKEPEAKGLLVAELGSINGPVLGICLRDFRASRRFQEHHYSRAYNSENLESYHRAAFAVARHAIERYNCKVVFFPMHTLAPDDDRRLAHEVYSQLKDVGLADSAHVVEHQYGPREMKGMLGVIDFLVGVRFHSVVLGISMGTPTLGFSYALKNSAFLKYVGLERLAVDLNELSEDKGIEMLDGLIKEQLLTRKHIKSETEQWEGRFREYYDNLLPILKANNEPL